MKYRKADILPKELLEEIQKYVQGEYIYIPIARQTRKRWGECSGERERLNARNEYIRTAYKNGCSVRDLADEQCITEYAIHKILHRKE